MLLSNPFLQFLRSVQSPISMGDMLELFCSSDRQCIFIKNDKFEYCYANNNYLQLMGLQKLNQLMQLSDHDLSQNKKSADTYRELDNHILAEGTSLSVCENVAPNLNQPIVKTMQGMLYPLFANSDRPNYILGVVTPHSKLLKLNFDTVFQLSQRELYELLIKRRYTVQLSFGWVILSKMEICTLIHLLKGGHAGDVAKELGIKQTTVESYLVNIKNKLAVDSKSELINLIHREKILQQIVL